MFILVAYPSIKDGAWLDLTLLCRNMSHYLVNFMLTNKKPVLELFLYGFYLWGAGFALVYTQFLLPLLKACSQKKCLNK